MGRLKKYQTEEERKAARRESVRKWRETNKEKIAEYNKQYYEENKSAIAEWQKQYYKQYYSTPIGRANMLISNYRWSDKMQNRGECTLTAQWIVDNIFTSKCIYCGKTDWTELGCDRINNDLPHTPDNVVCCCEECNKKRKNKPFDEFLQKSKEIPKPITDASPLFTGS